MNVKLPLETGGPYQCERRRFSDEDMHWSLFDSSCGTVAHVFEEEWAKKIATAVNCHDELVECLAIALKTRGSISGDEIRRCDEILQKAKPGA